MWQRLQRWGLLTLLIVVVGGLSWSLELPWHRWTSTAEPTALPMVGGEDERPALPESLTGISQTVPPVVNRLARLSEKLEDHKQLDTKFRLSLGETPDDVFTRIEDPFRQADDGVSIIESSVPRQVGTALP